MGLLFLAMGLGLTLGVIASAVAAKVFSDNEKKQSKNAVVENEQQTNEFIESETQNQILKEKQPSKQTTKVEKQTTKEQEFELKNDK